MYVVCISDFWILPRSKRPGSPHNTAVIGSHSHHIPSQFTVISFTHVVSTLQVVRLKFRIISYLPHACYMSAHLILPDFTTLIMVDLQYTLRSPLLRNFFTLRSKQSLQHPALFHPQSLSFPFCEKSNLSPTQYRQNHILTEVNFLGQIAASRGEGFPTFHGLIPSPSSGCCLDSAEPKLFWFSRTPSTTLKMGTELVPQTSENLHILTLLSARYYFIEFCRCESFKICVF
jgi:hypothetical protein